MNGATDRGRTSLDRLELRSAEEPGHMAGRAMYESFKAVTDPFEQVDLRLVNDGWPEATVDSLCLILQQVLEL